MTTQGPVREPPVELTKGLLVLAEEMNPDFARASVGLRRELGVRMATAGLGASDLDDARISREASEAREHFAWQLWHEGHQELQTRHHEHETEA